MRQPLLLAVSFALLAACARTSAPGTPPAVPAIAMCDDVARVAAPADAYRETPVYVANEMPVDEVRAWAAGKPGFEVLWIDRDHRGWITVAFSEGAAARQAELAAEFPGVGVVAVAVDWTMAGLEALERRVADQLRPLFEVGTSTSVVTGMVEVHVGVLSDERIREVQARFTGERVCVTGADPAEVVPEGPQVAAGDGWRMLASEPGTGESYRTGIAWDAGSYDALWQRIGLGGDPPPVDFETEVVVWFGAVFGSGCDGLRLDDVVVEGDRSLVHGEIVLPGPPAACNADANPHAFVLAVARSKLPAPPFAIQLGADDPPAGVPEERTVVDADLRVPASIAAPGQVHGDPRLPRPEIPGSGAVVEPGFPGDYRLLVHCGIEWLGELNGVAWRADVPPDFIPAAWQPLVVDGSIVVSVLLETGDPPKVTATANGHAVVYLPTGDEPPGCR